MAEPISFTQGETVTATITINDGDGLPIDITGNTFEAEIRSVDDLTVLVAEFDCEILAPEAPAVFPNKVKITLDSEASFAIEPNLTYSTKGILNTVPTSVYIMMFSGTSIMVLILIFVVR